MESLTRNFTLNEFACPCCGLYNFAEETLDKIQLLRDFYGKPIVPSSVCRCVAHNLEVDGSPNSYHLAEGKQANAIDIPFAKPQDGWRLLKLATMLNFRGIIVYPKHIHLDDRLDWYFSIGKY